MHEAVESASPEVASVLRRVIVEEPMAGDPELGDPVDSVVAVLLREAARRALGEIEVRSRAEGAGGGGAIRGRPGRPRPLKCGSGWTNSENPKSGATPPSDW